MASRTKLAGSGVRTSGGRFCFCGRVVSDHHSSALAAPLEVASLGIG